HLRYERNLRLHNSVASSPPIIFKTIDRLIRNILLARKNFKSFKNLMQVWLKHS
ncbi:hypothetical protein F2Q69_00020824, partial [Brassica cretica]